VEDTFTGFSFSHYTISFLTDDIIRMRYVEIDSQLRKVSNVSNYDVTYGSLGAVVGMMIWLWVTFVVVLVGAELNAELEHQTSEIQQREGRTRI
jgi:hypothetical protein